MSKKPGVMIYFDMLPAIRNLSNSDKGILFEAILEYGQSRRQIPLSNKVMVIWPLIQQRMAVDEMRYMRTVMRRAYAAYRRWAKQQGEEPMEFLQWQEKKGYALIDEEYDEGSEVFLPCS